MLGAQARWMSDGNYLIDYHNERAIALENSCHYLWVALFADFGVVLGGKYSTEGNLEK
jgi:hypothetical protein